MTIIVSRAFSGIAASFHETRRACHDPYFVEDRIDSAMLWGRKVAVERPVVSAEEEVAVMVVVEDRCGMNQTRGEHATSYLRVPEGVCLLEMEVLGRPTAPTATKQKVAEVQMIRRQ